MGPCQPFILSLDKVIPILVRDPPLLCCVRGVLRVMCVWVMSLEIVSCLTPEWWPCHGKNSTKLRPSLVSCAYGPVGVVQVDGSQYETSKPCAYFGISQT